MNDPNALWRDDAGRWHLWYQHRDDAPRFERTHWARLVSDDGLLWQDAGIAFMADERGYRFSGSLLALPAGRLRAYLTLHAHAAGTVHESVALWESEKDPAGPWAACGAPSIAGTGGRGFRDPFVFRFGAGWRMLVAEPCPWDADAPGPSRSTLSCWASEDGVAWQRSGTFGPWDEPRVMWEVPQMLPLAALGAPAHDRRWLLLLSVLDRRAGAIDGSQRWCSGHFDGRVFEPDMPLQRLDHGPDCYAACLAAGGGPPMLVAWMSQWRYARRLPFDGFAGRPMTLPRRLGWEDGALRQWPLHGSLPAAFEVPAGHDGLIDIGLPPGTRLRLDRTACALVLERDAIDDEQGSLPGFGGHWAAPLAGLIEDGEDGVGLSLEVVTDGCCVEIFVAGGHRVMSALVAA